MEYRRSRIPGGVFFFTVVTNQRRQILVSSGNRGHLRRAFRDVRCRRDFTLDAIVLLPDHLHLLMHLPHGDADYSIRIGGIKRRFTDLYLASGGKEAPMPSGRKAKRYRGVWQPRFWEHAVRDAEDYKRHLDYIHANPVKHGLVSRVGDWQWSSFHRYVRLGEYDLDWAGHVDLPHEVEYLWAD